MLLSWNVTWRKVRYKAFVDPEMSKASPPHTPRRPETPQAHGNPVYLRIFTNADLNEKYLEYYIISYIVLKWGKKGKDLGGIGLKLEVDTDLRKYKSLTKKNEENPKSRWL